MIQKPVVILSGGSEIVATALVEELLSSGFYPSIISLNKNSILASLSKRLPFRVLNWPPHTLESCSAELIDHLQTLGATTSHKIPIFATEDGGLRFILEAREQINPWVTFGYAHRLRMGGLDKAELFTVLEQVDCFNLIAPFRVAKTVDDAIEAISHFSNDAVIKPALKPFSMQMTAMKSKALMSRHFKNIGFIRQTLEKAWPLSQQWIVQQRLSTPPSGEKVVWAIRDGEGSTYCLMADEIWKQPRDGGTGCWVRIADQSEALSKKTRVILEKIDFIGICEIPFLLDQDGQWRMLELNPRPWLQVGLPFRAGVPMVSATTGILYGEKLPNLPPARSSSWVNIERLFLAASSSEQGPRIQAYKKAWEAWIKADTVAIYDTSLPGVRRRWVARLLKQAISRIF